MMKNIVCNVVGLDILRKYAPSRIAATDICLLTPGTKLVSDEYTTSPSIVTISSLTSASVWGDVSNTSVLAGFGLRLNDGTLPVRMNCEMIFVPHPEGVVSVANAAPGK